MVEYLSGGRIQGSTALVSSPPQTAWKELDRVTLGSSGDSMDTGTFTAKDNIMILEHKIPTGNARSKYRFNGDDDDNYATRRNQNGGSDGTFDEESFLYQYHSGGTAEGFSVSQYSNISAQEKLGIAHVVENNDSGANNAPTRDEYAQKWANTSAQINRVEVFNDGTGSYNTGSEIVVLGCDNDESDSGTNFWQELDSVELTSSSSEITSNTFTAKKYLMLELYHINTGGHVNPKLQFNGDSSSNYASRYSDNGGSDSTSTSQSEVDLRAGEVQSPATTTIYVINKSDKEKLFISNSNMQNTAGAGNAPSRAEVVGKWTNTSAQITSVKFIKTASGSFNTGSYLKVYGAD